MANKTFIVLDKQVGTPLEISVRTKRIAAPVIIQPTYTFDVSDLYGYFVPEVSFGTSFYWNSSNYLDISGNFGSDCVFCDEFKSNTLVGWEAGKAQTTGRWNVAVGYKSLLEGTSGEANTTIGMFTGYHFTTASYNTAIGYGSMLTSGSDNGYNTAVGSYSLLNIDRGEGNVAIGHDAGRFKGTVGAHALYDASYCTLIGYDSRIAENPLTEYEIAIGASAIGHGPRTATLGDTTNTTATYLYGDLYVNDTLYNLNHYDAGYNTFVGQLALSKASHGTYNVALGANALQDNSSGNYNIAIGYAALVNSIGNSNNIAIGFLSMPNNMTGNSNIALGGTTLGHIISGSGNVALGESAGDIAGDDADNTTSNYSIFIGYDSRPEKNNQTYQIAIGTAAVGHGSYTTTIGTTDTSATYLYGTIYADNSAGFTGKYLADGSTITVKNGIIVSVK